MTDPHGARSVLARTREDVRFAWKDLLFSRIAGSPWLPRLLRRMLFVWAGADMHTAPGVRLVFVGDPRNLSVGYGGYMNQRVFVEAIAPVRIGNDTGLGMDVMILTSHHPLDGSGAWQRAATGMPVSIGDRVWIGARSVILPGAVVESDVVVAAGAVVTGRCASGGLYAGVPARRIREYDRGAAGPDATPAVAPSE